MDEIKDEIVQKSVDLTEANSEAAFEFFFDHAGYRRMSQGFFGCFADKSGLGKEKTAD